VSDIFKAQVKLAVLRQLATADSSGYDLMKFLASYASKPSPGYIYPLLHALRKNGLVSVKVQGRKKVYSITIRGKRFLVDLEKKHQELMRSMLKNFEPISDKSEQRQFYKVMQSMHGNREKMFRDMDVFRDFNSAFLQIYQGDYDKKRLAMRGIIAKAATQLRELAKK